MSAQLSDVIEVSIGEPHVVRMLARDKSEQNAEAIINMAIYRRGVETHFYTTAPAGKYADGDVYSPNPTST